MDISVTLPGGASIEVQGLASDCIGDVRTLLSQHPATCHQTNFSLSHKVRGPNLKPSTDVAALKPLELEIVEEPYTDASSAMAQVRHLAELVAPYNSSVRPCVQTFLLSPPPPSFSSLEKKGRRRSHACIRTLLCIYILQLFFDMYM